MSRSIKDSNYFKRLTVNIGAEKNDGNIDGENDGNKGQPDLAAQNEGNGSHTKTAAKKEGKKGGQNLPSINDGNNEGNKSHQLMVVNKEGDNGQQEKPPINEGENGQQIWPPNNSGNVDGENSRQNSPSIIDGKSKLVRKKKPKPQLVKTTVRLQPRIWACFENADHGEFQATVNEALRVYFGMEEE